MNKLYGLEIIIYILLLFDINVVYSDNTVDDSSDDKDKHNTSKDGEEHSINDSFIYTHISKFFTNEYVFKADTSELNKLRYPNRIDTIRLNDYTVQFDYNTKLPNVDVEILYMYTCKHNNPVLIHMYGDSRYYYYSLNTKTNRWDNYILQHDKKFLKFGDENGAPYYLESISEVSSYLPTNNRKGKFEDSELSKTYCKKKKCGNVDITDNDNIEISASKPKIYTLNCSHTDSFQIEPLTRRFIYKVNESLQGKLEHPNIMYGIRFYNYLIPFDNNAKLPSINIEYISIYTCEHNNPVLISIYGNSRYYYYSLDPKTNVWNNYTLKYCKKFTLNIDNNGISFYLKPNSDLSYSHMSCCRKKYSSEDKKLAKKLCKNEKFYNAIIEELQDISIYIKFPE